MSDTERDNLIRWSKELADPDWCLSVVGVAKIAIRRLVAVVEDLTPRVITTVEELDALPMGSVVLSQSMDHYSGDFPISFQRWANGEWHRPGRSADTHHDNFLPATVLYEPTK